MNGDKTALPDYMELAYYDPEIEDLEPDTRPLSQRDSRPERVQYRDEGCDIAPECLACPLPKCRYDDPGWLRREAKNRRDREIVAARLEQRISPAVIAQRFGLTRRRVQRIIQEGKEAYVARPNRAAEDDPESQSEAPRGI